MSERNPTEVKGLGSVVEQILEILLPRRRRKRGQALDDRVVELEAGRLLTTGSADHTALEDALETSLEGGEPFGRDFSRVVEDALHDRQVSTRGSTKRRGRDEP